MAISRGGGGYGPPGLALASFSTSFPLTENPINQSGVWTLGGTVGLDWTNPATGLASDGATHVAYCTQVPGVPPPYNDSVACLSGYAPNQWCQGTIYNDGGIVGLPEVELLLHWSIGAHSITGYEVDVLGDGRVALARWNGAVNDFTLVVAATTINVSVANNAAWYAKAENGLITVRCNGNECLTYDYSGDGSTLHAGQPGMGFYADSLNGTPNSNTQANRHFAWKAYSAGNL